MSTLPQPLVITLNDRDGTIEGKRDDPTEDALDAAADNSRDGGAEVEGAGDMLRQRHSRI